MRNPRFHLRAQCCAVTRLSARAADLLQLTAYGGSDTPRFDSIRSSRPVKCCHTTSRPKLRPARLTDQRGTDTLATPPVESTASAAVPALLRRSLSRRLREERRRARLPARSRSAEALRAQISHQHREGRRRRRRKWARSPDEDRMSIDGARRAKKARTWGRHGGGRTIFGRVPVTRSSVVKIDRGTTRKD